MVTVKNSGVYLIGGRPVDAAQATGVLPPDQAREKTMA